MAELCEHYQGPVYAYFRDHGADAEEARDLTQGLFVKLIAHETFARVDQARGSFRSYLFKAAARHDKDERVAATAPIRDPGTPLFSFDTTEAEERYTQSDESLSPEQAYDRRWAHTVLDRVFARIHADLEAKGQPDRWAWLEPLLRTGLAHGETAALAERLGKNESSLRAYVARMRQRAEDYVMQEIEDQVDVEDARAATKERERLREQGLQLGPTP